MPNEKQEKDIADQPSSPAPFYMECGREKAIFRAAFDARLPVMLKGPTGCGKTRFVEHMAHELGRPLITVACHEDLFASDLVGRFLLKADETVWTDGPLTRAVRAGAICYLDEVVEARKDTTVVIHPLTDNRRTMYIEKTGETVKAHPGFILVVSYNPGYQSVLKDLKQSTRQRFVSIELDYAPPEIEQRVITAESGTDPETAKSLVDLARKIRDIREQGLAEGASTRLLVYAALLIKNGVPPKAACRSAMGLPLTDDEALLATVDDLIEDVF